MHPADCPDWEYDNHPDKTTILQQEIKNILIDLRARRVDSSDSVTNTKNFHYRLFNQLTPKDCPYYAGHYRGEEFRCLKFNQVGIRSDPRVGFQPNTVPGYMKEFSKIAKKSIVALDEGSKLPNAHISLADKILYIVAAACMIFEMFLRIHPYVNGNGHTARFCIWSILGRFNLWPSNFPIDPRPNPPYVDLIVEYRNGNPAPLEQFILQNLIRN